MNLIIFSMLCCWCWNPCSPVQGIVIPSCFYSFKFEAFCWNLHNNLYCCSFIWTY